MGRNFKRKRQAWKNKDREIQELAVRISKECQTIESHGARNLFEELPLSEKTQNGLSQGGFKRMKAIQRDALPQGLAGRDVLGSSKTGGGKTLAFLIPVLERLYASRWTSIDGLGALILSPTRELAIQIFEVLKRIGKEHDFSAGLVIGGKSYTVEADLICRMNILVGTPGRVLHHLHNTPMFSFDSLQLFVLDEADMCLSLGFKESLDSIIEALPRKRQTLLFSATQTESVQDLARVSLSDPVKVAVHESAASATPIHLSQHCMVLPAEDKISVLFSFLKSHSQSKLLVFVSTCKQVRYLFESFRRLRPGIPLLHLHGRMKQEKRLFTFEEFKQRDSVAMFCTNVTARGLDIQGLDWIVQMDCPEDVDTYIHRVGRTARNESKGKALLFLLPSETNFLNKLKERNVQVSKVKPNKSQTVDLTKKLQGLLAQDADLKYLAQKHFITYLKSIHVQHDTDIFDVTKLNVTELAHSLGLAQDPVVKLSKRKKRQKTYEQAKSAKDDSQSKIERLLQRVNHGVLDASREQLRDIESDSDSDVLYAVEDETVNDAEQRQMRPYNNTDIFQGELRAAAVEQDYTNKIRQQIALVDDDDAKAQKMRIKAEKQRKKLLMQQRFAE